MPDQQTLPGTPDPGGLWSRFTTAGRIDHPAWLRARAEGQPVGTCRACGGHLMPEPYEEHAGRVDYTAACRNPACGATMTAPGGRLFKGPAIWSESGGAGRAQALAIAAREEAKRR